MNDKCIGFIGLGNMGGRMTRCLIDAGIHVIGYDADPGAAERIGAAPVRSIGDLMGQVDVVLMSLPDSKVVEQVVEGDGGVLTSGRAGQIVVDLSTAAATSTRRLAKRLAKKDIAFIDAGVSGGAAKAEQGALTLMVGGDIDAIQELEAVFDPIAASVFVMGESGAGHTTKLLNNFLNAVSLSATAEVMVAGKKAGLDLHKLLEVLNASSGINFATINRFPKIVDGNYLKGGLTSKLMMKDVVLYSDLMHELGVASLNAAGPLASFGLSTSLGYGDVISNHVVDAIGDISGHVRLNSDD